MVQKLFMDYASKMQVATYVGVEDFADKFNFIFTVIVLLVATSVVTVKQYILKPISCYISTEVGGKNLLNYVENYCWVQGTIPIAYSSDVPETEEDWNRLESRKILYYQWVPFVLGLQCIMFLIPRVIWQIICYNQTGTDLYHLISLANQASRSKPDKKDDLVKNLAKSVEQLLYHRNNIKKFKTQPSGSEEKPPLSHQVFKYRSTLAAPTYLLIKILSLTNSVAQLYLMHLFLGFKINSTPYGLVVVYDLIHGRDWQATLVFPRVAFCYTKLKSLGARENAITAQCALPVNMLNERIYVFLWWWIMAGGLMTLCSFFFWLFHIFWRASPTRYVERRLVLALGMQNNFDFDEIQNFASKFIRHDGEFILRMVGINAGEIMVGETLVQLWNWYLERRGLKQREVGAFPPLPYPDSSSSECASAFGAPVEKINFV
nr:innexin unc 9 [Hymenolepis microstoma]